MATKHINIKEFCEKGFLQEANRQFFHPHGLALEVTVIDEDFHLKKVNDYLEHLGEEIGGNLDEYINHLIYLIVNEEYPLGSEFISGVWDYRDDPEGIWFDWNSWPKDYHLIANTKAESVDKRTQEAYRASKEVI